MLFPVVTGQNNHVANGQTCFYTAAMMSARDPNHPMTEPLIEGRFYTLEQEKPLYVRIGTPVEDCLPGGDFYYPIDVRCSDGNPLRIPHI